ncbi:hypothetical protein [Mycoplasma bradburyae]|uniref:Uncharacterized protein n=1 Tax=Mycoplasma bradburyae TaxID=2963128 RepID=A0ABT5GAY3_9MOLU|nr:hypothetical protein [Mycoplasma bradburyae]MDC4181988.1 hypothetical protein [Mycoplasma bradburyae]UTS70413.1 hypothetical protein NMG68_01595 [Mycoplasma bradburyae]
MVEKSYPQVALVFLLAWVAFMIVYILFCIILFRTIYKNKLQLSKKLKSISDLLDKKSKLSKMIFSLSEFNKLDYKKLLYNAHKISSFAMAIIYVVSTTILGIIRFVWFNDNSDNFYVIALKSDFWSPIIFALTLFCLMYRVAVQITIDNKINPEIERLTNFIVLDQNKYEEFLNKINELNFEFYDEETNTGLQNLLKDKVLNTFTNLFNIDTSIISNINKKMRIQKIEAINFIVISLLTVIDKNSCIQNDNLENKNLQILIQSARDVKLAFYAKVFLTKKIKTKITSKNNPEEAINDKLPSILLSVADMLL